MNENQQNRVPTVSLLDKLSGNHHIDGFHLCGSAKALLILLPTHTSYRKKMPYFKTLGIGSCTCRVKYELWEAKLDFQKLKKTLKKNLSKRLGRVTNCEERLITQD